MLVIAEATNTTTFSTSTNFSLHPAPPTHPARRTLSKQGSEEPATSSEVIIIRVELVFFLIHGRHVGEVYLVSEQATNTTKALDELSTFLRTVGDELQIGTKLLVLLGEPFKEGLRLQSLFHLGPGRFVHELFAILVLFFVGVNDNFLC